MAALPGEALPNRSQTGLFPMLWPVFATSNLPMSASVPSRRSETVISPTVFQLRLEKITEQAYQAFRHLRGRLHCAVKPIGPHRTSEYALHLPGTAFGLLGVLLEGPSATDTGFRHPEPPHDRSPSVLGLFFGQTFGTATLPTDATVASSRSHCEFVYRIAALLGFVKVTWHEPLLIIQ